jgi:hypothetical protein|tara:strand:- start:101 stop:874 length:774 start_codon:yes stop_codon:yes gene_type:complete
LNGNKLKIDIVKALVGKKTVSRVKKLINNDYELISFELFDLNFRLNKSTGLSINLELLTSHITDDIQNRNMMVNYYRPVGYYIWDNGFFAKTITLISFSEFETISGVMIPHGPLRRNFVIKPLDFVSNAIIAGFSMNTFAEVENIFFTIKNSQSSMEFNYNKRIFSNGMEINLTNSSYYGHYGIDDYPTMFVKGFDYGYPVKGFNYGYPVKGYDDELIKIGAFQLRDGEIYFKPDRRFEGMYEILRSKGLLSPFQTI